MNDTQDTAVTTGPARRGRLKVFLGMAAGVGKTYRMLVEGVAEAANGRDVVIGYLEPHDREETSAQAEGLEAVPRIGVDQGLEEMDVAAILRRAPELCLVDELAHTNAAGSTNHKRFEDVKELIAAGIDVFTTMNVQHLESLNDQVAELTGTRVRETVPDAVLQDADEVVLIDLTPEALIARLQAGKVYPEDRVATALNNFFKIENLTSLRSVALRQVADEVESKRLTVEKATSSRDDDDRLSAQTGPLAIGERAMALVAPKPGSQRVLRRAWRSAQRLGAGLDVLWVAPVDTAPSEEQRRQIDAIERLCSVLGAKFITANGDDLVEAVGRVARERGTTYLLLGPPSSSLGKPWAKRSLVDRLIAELPGVDIRVIADRSKLAYTPGDEVNG